MLSKIHTAKVFQVLKNNILGSCAKPTLLRPSPLVILPQKRHLKQSDRRENANIIKANIPDLTRSYESLPSVLENNRKWANSVSSQNTKLFENLAGKTSDPKIFWIGCSDSRVVPETIAQLGFGQIFVHRNIANQFNGKDANCMSVLEFVVNKTDIEHIIVCGHTECIGVKNATDDKLPPHLKAWLSDIRSIKDKNPELFPDHVKESSLTKSEIDKLHKELVGINVKNQVSKIASNEIIREAWKKGTKLEIHGWIFDMSNGFLEDLKVSTAKP